MCFPPDGNPSHRCVGKAKGINNTQWAVDQRPFIWAAPLKPSENPQEPACKSWADNPFYPGAPLPCAGIQVKAGGSDKQLEVGSPSGSGGSHRASPATPVPKRLQQYKAWVPLPNGREAGTASGVATHQQSLSREDSVVSCTSSPRISMPAVAQETTQSTKVPTRLIDAWEGSKSKERSVRSSPWVEDLIKDDRMQNGAAMKRKLSIDSTYTEGTSKGTPNKPARYFSKNNRPAVAKEIPTRSKDVSISESLSNNEDESDDEGEGSPYTSEKRRKRMLSNRASAQRSRQRRQERLDTLEVLVAELRVENAALRRRGVSVNTAAKKFEEEIKILRDRLGKQESVPLLDNTRSIESDKTTQNSDVAVNNKSGPALRAAPGIHLTTNGSSAEYTKETGHNDYSRESSWPPTIDPYDDKPGANLKRWNNISGSSFDFDFNSDPMECGAPTDCGSLSRTATLPEHADGGQIVKDMYQSAMMSLPQTRSLQALDPFGIDLEQYNQEMDKKDLESTSEDDMWLDSLANCLSSPG